MKEEGTGLRLSPEDSFARTLDRLVPEGRLGVAVSGGPDSLALLLLAAGARPGAVEAATVDHGLRAGSAAEAEMVSGVCRHLGVPHEVLPVVVADGSSLQAHAREARYAALGEWAKRRGLAAIATAHHADDQAETLLMRLARGSGLSGLAGVRETRLLASGVRLVRPLLGWRKTELVTLVETAGLQGVDDPANRDQRHDRTIVRTLLAANPALDPVRLARSAAALGDAEEALGWLVERLAEERMAATDGALEVDVGALARDLKRRLLLAGYARLGREAPDGPSIDRALALLDEGGSCTLGGLMLRGGGRWTLKPEPPRRP